MKQGIFKNPHNICRIFALALLILLTVPKLVQDGMFMDAVQYSAIAHNLSLGIGDFWHPQFDLYNIHDLPAFYEQPPFGFYIQSLFFRILGGSMYTERIYTFFCLLTTAFLIHILWKVIFKNKQDEKKYSWLAVIFWISIPIVLHNYQNNLLENTMTIFLMAATISIYKAMTGINARFNLITGGIFIFLASFTKGLPGIFPLAIPLLYAMIIEKQFSLKRSMQSVILLFIPAVFYAILFCIPAGAENLRTYFFERAFARIQSEAVNSNRFSIILSAVLEVSGIALLVLICLWVNKRKWKVPFHNDLVRTGWFFLCIGMCASFPLALTKVQKQFYLSPAMPFFAIGFAIIIVPVVQHFFSEISQRKGIVKISAYLSILFLLLAITCSIVSVGKINRNENIIHDTKTLGETLPAFSVISATNAAYYDWNLQANIIRKYNIMLDNKNAHPYFLYKKYEAQPADPAFTRMDLPLTEFVLYKK